MLARLGTVLIAVLALVAALGPATAAAKSTALTTSTPNLQSLLGPTSVASPAALQAAAWSALGSNGASDGALGSYVSALVVYNGEVYAGGGFTNADGDATADYLARWNGSAWSGVGSNGAGNGALTGPIKALAVFDGSLVVGGDFTNAGGAATADYVARWNGSAWSGIGSNGAGNGAITNMVRAVAATGEELYIGGDFGNAGGNAAADYAARWGGAWGAIDGSTTTPPITASVYALAVYDNDVYVGGAFQNAAGIAEADRLVKWNGLNWSALGSNGAGDGALNVGVYAIYANGSTVYAGGAFTNAAGLAKADYIARWDGAWHSLGSNGAGNGALNGSVYAITISNSYVYVGGDYDHLGNNAAGNKIAVWKGSSWALLPANGGGTALGGAVLAALVKAGVLYVGGIFPNASGIAAADYVAAYGPLTEPTIRPDGLIKKGSTGTLVGGNIYNLNAANQSRSALKVANTKATFYVVAQNDGSVSDKFALRQFFTTSAGFTVRYYRGTTDITSALVAGTYVTPSVAPGSSVTIKVVVSVGSTSVVGTGTWRVIRISSFKDATKVDTVSFTVTRS